jgi:hypothetical protein
MVEIVQAGGNRARIAHVNRTPRAMLLAVLFIGSGLLTYQIYYWVAKSGSDSTQMLRQLLTGLPFGAACSLRFMQVRKWIVPAIMLDCVAWVLAFRLGLALSGNANPYLGMGMAGVAGAVIVTVAGGFSCRRLYARRVMIGSAVAGALPGALFGLVLTQPGHENLILALCFPLWQVVVGLWIGGQALA